MKIIYSSINESDVQLAKIVLEDADIPATVLDANTAVAAWHYALAIGGIKLAVADEHLRRAQLVLEQYLSKIRSPDAKAIPKPKDPKTCPQCGSEDISMTRIPTKLPSILVTLLFMIPVPLRACRIQCNKCKAYWRH